MTEQVIIPVEQVAHEHVWRRRLSPQTALLVVAVIYVLATLPGIRELRTLLWDEAIYASQFATGAHPLRMSAPRAWGMPLLLAPIDVLTTSTVAIRLYLSALSGIGLFLAFRPWLRIGDAWVAPVAATVFATLWTTTLFGAMGYPNLWLAFAIVAGIGYGVRALGDPTDRWAMVGLVVAFVFASMFRPSDTAYMAAPLVLLLLVRRVWRPLVATVAGIAVGWIAWGGESFIRFGDPITRLRLTSTTNDIALGFYPLPLVQAADGPYLVCRPATMCLDIHPLELVWLVALPLLVIAGILATRPRTPYLLAAVSGACLVVSYLFTLDWAAARYLSPTYALLALPVAAALVAAVRWRRAMAVVIVVALLFHVGMQLRTYQRVTDRLSASTLRTTLQAESLRDALGVRPDCVVFGPDATELSFVLGCEGDWSADSPTPADPLVQAVTDAGRQAVIVVRAPDTLPVAPDGWRVAELDGGGSRYGIVSGP